MGKIIHYDFRRVARQQEMEEIRHRAHERLLKSLSNPEVYYNEETRKKIREDNLRYLQLEREEREWGGRLQWEE